MLFLRFTSLAFSGIIGQLRKQKVSFMATYNPVAFLREVQVELGKVKWPSRKEAVKLTAIVIGVSAAVSLYIGLLDFVFAKVMEILVK